MHSAAGHDAQILARAMPAAMWFVPSISGISHHWPEDTRDDDSVLGTQIFADGVAAILRGWAIPRSGDLACALQRRPVRWPRGPPQPPAPLLSRPVYRRTSSWRPLMTELGLTMFDGNDAQSSQILKNGNPEIN